MACKNYRDLEIYKKAHELAVAVHKMSLTLPKFEMYEQGSQIRRSSKSIKSNIVEGYGRRRYKLDFIRFLTFSLASCDETADHIDTLFETGSLTDKQKYEYLRNGYDHLGRMINRFISTVGQSHNSGKSRLPIEDQVSSIEDQ